VHVNLSRHPQTSPELNLACIGATQKSSDLDLANLPDCSTSLLNGVIEGILLAFIDRPDYLNPCTRLKISDLLFALEIFHRVVGWSLFAFH
jgi:hypothetical protein